MIAYIKTWKMGPDRYLHEIAVSGVWFYLVTNSYYLYPKQLTLRNVVSRKRNEKMWLGFRLVRSGAEELNDFIWEWICFGGEDNKELREKAYGKELELVELEMKIWSNGAVDSIVELKTKKELLKHKYCARIRGRCLRKRIKNPLSYISRSCLPLDEEETLKIFHFTVPKLYLIRFINENSSLVVDL